MASELGNNSFLLDDQATQSTPQTSTGLIKQDGVIGYKKSVEVVGSLKSLDQVVGNLFEITRQDDGSVE